MKISIKHLEANIYSLDSQQPAYIDAVVEVDDELYQLLFQDCESSVLEGNTTYESQEVTLDQACGDGVAFAKRINAEIRESSDFTLSNFVERVLQPRVQALYTESMVTEYARKK